MAETGAPRPAFTPVDPQSWPRREYFAYYFEKLKCRYSLTAQLDISLLLRCKARPGTPENFCSISSLPWLSFMSFAQDTYAESRLLAPLIRVGRHFSQGRKTLLPVALSVHHAVADGFHTAKHYHDMQAVADAAEQWLC